MTKETFIKKLYERDILWNDRVIITIINPYKKKYNIFTPNTLSFEGTLNFFDSDNDVEILVFNGKTHDFEYLSFEFSQIIGIKKK